MNCLTNIRLPDPLITNSESNYWRVYLNDNHIIDSILPMSKDFEFSGEDWKGDFLSPRAVDLQVNGGLGLSFPDITFEDLPKLCCLLELLWKHGVEAIAPTFVTCSSTSLREGLLVLREARKQHVQNRCRLLGAHLEGPFLSRKFVGAHNLDYLISPDLAELDKRIHNYESEISLVTLAPELPGAMDLIKRLRELGIVVSLGHSSANEAVTKEAFLNGLTMFTHVFNAMPGLHHRFPGPIAEAISNGNISLGLIADGVHVHPLMATLLHKLAPKQLVLVSDAIAPYGLQDGTYTWDKRVIFSKEGCCRLPNGTLVGATLPLLDGCRKLAQWTGNIGSSIWSATIAPREVLSRKNLMTKDYLVGKSLKELLRWETNLENNHLFWRSAA